MEKTLQLYNEDYSWPSSINEFTLSRNTILKIFSGNYKDLKNMSDINLNLNELKQFANLSMQFKIFADTFKEEFTTLLKNISCTNIEISPNYFYIDGYFETEWKQIWYFNLGDIRFKLIPELMVRRCKSYTDNTGGRDQYISTNNKSRFINELCSILNKNK